MRAMTRDEPAADRPGPLAQADEAEARGAVGGQRGPGGGGGRGGGPPPAADVVIRAFLGMLLNVPDDNSNGIA
ncbi:hypothetical protein I6A84_38065, partial [Frankia sp. CNm7]